MTSLAGHHAHLAPRQREEIVRRVEAGEESMRTIAAALGVSESTVSKTYKKWCETGSLVEHLTGGHSSVYDDDDFYHLDCLINQHPSATAETLHALMPSTSPTVSTHTIDMYRLVLGYTHRKPAVWEFDSERTARLRAEWLAEHRAADHTQWVYMDESTLCLRDTGEWVWVKQGEETPVHEIHHLRCHVNVWGAVWSQGSVFSFYSGHLKAVDYIDLLKTHLLPHKRQIGRRIVVHDRATTHTAKATKQWCAQQDLEILLLPPHSPQFNAIERVWGWLKREVRKIGPEDHGSLEEALRQAQHALPQDVVRSFIKEARDNIVAY
jgi:transposase